jgi:hypothetical protein
MEEKMSKPIVYVIYEPMKFDAASHTVKRWADLSPAAEFGDLKFILPAGQVPMDLSGLLPKLKDAFKDFRSTDYLMAIGNPALLAWGAALASKAAQGKLQVLVWQTSAKRYQAVAADLFTL